MIKEKTNEEKLQAVKLYVRRQRKARGIKGFPGPQPQPSCWGSAIGEFGNLVEFSLAYRPEESWNELKDPEILDGVYRYVAYEPPKKIRRSRN